MKASRFFLLVICLSVFLTLFSPNNQVLAEDYNTSATFFANDVSTVAPGDSRTLTLIDEFWGLSWDVSGGIGNPVYGDGNTSNDDTGFYMGVETDGRIGVYAEAAYDNGTMDINTPLDINMHTTDTGASTIVTTDYSILSGAGFSTSDADGNIDLGFLAEATFKYTAAASVGEAPFSTGISTYGAPLDGAIYSFSLVNAAVGIAEASVYTATYGILTVDANMPDASLTAAPLTAANGLSGVVDYATRTASVSQTSDILSVSADLDKLFTYYTEIPLGFSASLSNDTLGIDIGATVTAIDASIGGDISLNRNFDVTIIPSVHLEFDRPVFVDGISSPVTNVSTLLGRELSIYTQDIVGVNTTYSLDWSIRNRTSVDADASVSVTAGEISADIKLPYLDRFEPSLGPLYDRTFTTPSIGVDVYNERWSLSGQDIEGTFFLTNFDSELVTMLDKAIDETTQNFMVTGASFAARDILGTIIQDKNTATTPDPNEPKDLFTENSDLYWFLANNYNRDGDSELVDWISQWSDRNAFYEILRGYDEANANYFQFLLDDSIELGIDFQPLLEDGLVTGLLGSFYSFDEQSCPDNATSCDPTLETRLSSLGLGNLLDTSLAFFYNDLAGMTDLTVYRSSATDPASFAYAYSSLEQLIAPVPEPSTILLLGSGLLGLGWYGRKRKKS